ncbi:MAG TPA: hypothetical protein PKH39_00060 [Woeseiaceae bacterium]|nr:hypothetical protein [Woeseiaceae bacterium]
MAALHDRVVAVANLRDFFRESINTAIDNQNVDVNPHTSHYVVNLLTLFARSENFYDESDEHCGVRPLALMMADAADADSQEKRSSSLQRIGDVALFTAGFFADSLAYRPVDIDYYVRMGGSAYGSLSDEIKGTTRGMALVDVFREMARKFQSLVDVLNEVREGAWGSGDVVRVYEIWRKTGSRRAAKILEQNGVVPIGGTPKTH